MGRGASGRCSQRRRLRFLSREKDQWEVGTLGHVDFVHGMSCGKNPGGHDNAEPGNAEGTDLLCVPREIRGIAAARSQRKRTVHGLPRRPQQRPAHVAASRGRPAAFAAESKVKPRSRGLRERASDFPVMSKGIYDTA